MDRIAAACPDILDKSDIIWVDLQCFREPAIVELHALFLEEVILIWIVENLNSNHDEPRIMSTS